MTFRGKECANYLTGFRSPVGRDGEWRRADDAAAQAVVDAFDRAVLRALRSGGDQGRARPAHDHGGYQVAGKWFHSDVFPGLSKSAWSSARRASLPAAGLQWKTMDGSFDHDPDTGAAGVRRGGGIRCDGTRHGRQTKRMAMEYSTTPRITMCELAGRRCTAVNEPRPQLLIAAPGLGPVEGGWNKRYLSASTQAETRRRQAELALSGALATTPGQQHSSANGQLGDSQVSQCNCRRNNTRDGARGSVTISGALAVCRRVILASSGQVAIAGAVSATQADNALSAAGQPSNSGDIRNPSGQYARLAGTNAASGTSSQRAGRKHPDGNWRVVVVRLSVCDSTERFSDGFCGAGHRRPLLPVQQDIIR